jgi:hypothetical protein
MDAWKNPIEDERGVDISQIHRQLQMSVAERVRHMVEAANMFMEIRSHARFVDVPYLESLRDELRRQSNE